MGKFGSAATGIVDSLKSLLGSAGALAKKANLDRISKALDDIPEAAGDFSKVDMKKLFDSGILKNGTDIGDLKAILKNSGDIKLNPKQTKEMLIGSSKFMTKDTDLLEAGATLGEAGKSLDAAKSFFQRNEKTLLLIGVSAVGIATLMLLTGESDPSKAIGGALGNVAAAAGEGVGTGLGEGLGGLADGLDKGLGISDFFKNWGLYIGIFCAVLLMLGLFMMLK